jgi:uncharacterized damage-inducible protein DinB
MNREALNELCDFTDFTWAMYERAAKKLPPDGLTTTLDGVEWTTVRQPLIHVASAWDGWLANKAGDEFVEFDLDAIQTWAGIDEVRRKTRAWLRRVLDDMSDDDLFVKTEPTSDHPDANQVTAADVLLHILLHERGHHGDISTLLTQAGSPIRDTEYLVFRFFKDRKKS